MFFWCSFFKDFIYLFSEREREGEREREKHQFVISCTPPTRDQQATQACALTGNQTGDLLVHRPVLNPLTTPARAGKMF